METPFTPQFNQAAVPLTRVSGRPFIPTYPLPFVADETTQYYVGDGCQLSYRWHDAFDVFVAVLEVYMADAKNTTLTIPVTSHLNDLHLVYQLAGHSDFYPRHAASATPTLQLPMAHHLVVYTPPANALLHIRPDLKTRRFAVASSVPKGNWVTRHRSPKPNPLEGLLTCLRQKHTAHRLLAPSAITPHIHARLHLLLTTSQYPGMLMDDALNHSIAHLMEQHRTECAQLEQANQKAQLVASARLLVQTLVKRLDGDKLLTVSELAAIMHVRPRLLWKAHHHLYNTSLDHYINTQLMERAKAMLDEGISIKSVSLTLGYSTPNNFSRSFKKQYGISPNTYQKNIFVP